MHLYNIKENKRNNVKYYQTDYSGLSVEELENIGKYRNFVEKVLNGELSNKDKSQLCYLGNTPAKLVEAGIANNNLTIVASVIKKAQDKRNKDHNLSAETISEVYKSLHNPIAVIKSENNRYSAILDLQNDTGDYVLVALEIDKNMGSGVIINDIRSIHSRSNYEPLIDNALNNKRLLRVDIDKIRNLLLGGSGIIPEGGQASSSKDLLTSHQPDMISGGAASLLERIYQEQNNVKYYQSVYHGSPYDFDEFSTDNMGTGEGAQAHGWGLYFAENKDVSEDIAAVRKWLKNDGEEFTREQHEKFARGFETYIRSGYATTI